MGQKSKKAEAIIRNGNVTPRRAEASQISKS
jgi:hypothetical protein